MIFRLFFIFFCFLIINSCDLPNEANNDCNGVNLGSAYIDECGRCVDGDTNSVENEDKDCCGKCFGDHDDCNIACDKCGDINAINYDFCNFIESCNIYECGECVNLFEHNEELCVYDLCDYIPEINTSYTCNDSQDNLIYEIGDQLRCNDVEEALDICYPSFCDNEFSVSDLYGKVTWIDMTASW